MGAAGDGHSGHGHARGWAEVPIAGLIGICYTIAIKSETAEKARFAFELRHAPGNIFVNVPAGHALSTNCGMFKRKCTKS